MSDELADHFLSTRAATERFCEPLGIEDYGLQGMATASPPKWHLAHTSWFFETFILKVFKPGYQPFNPAFEVLFNSYYNGIGDQQPRAERGLLSRPDVGEVLTYRRVVNDAIVDLLSNISLASLEQEKVQEQYRQIARLVELGIQHEQQHQELFFTDIKYSLSRNPLYPAYLDIPLENGSPSAQGFPSAQGCSAVAQEWTEYPGGEATIGYQQPFGVDADNTGFCFDNELPAHGVLLQPYALANRLVTNSEYLEFIEDGGYRRPELWLADGWSTVAQNNWSAPLYWVHVDGGWFEYSLYGLMPLNPSCPVCHLSGYEADAFARWAQARLPTEFEWEAAARKLPVEGQFVESNQLHPRSTDRPGAQQYFGSLWQWTSSTYGAYPGFQAAAGAVGEYNGKFMANQLVLRGGSCVTSQSHIRASYRNFFYPPDRWQFSGIRLAKWL